MFRMSSYAPYGANVVGVFAGRDDRKKRSDLSFTPKKNKRGARNKRPPSH